MKKFFRAIIRLPIGLLLILVFFVPFYWMILTSIKSSGEILKFPPSFWVKDPQWINFSTAFHSIPFLQFTLNSVIVTAGVLACQFVTVIPAAYAYARYQFRGKKLLFGLTLLTMMIPSQLIFLPTFLLFSKWGLINSYWPLILPFACSAFGIFMLRQSFMQVSEEMIEAACMDGAKEYQIIGKILLPVTRPAIATVALFVFISSWNDYFWPLVMTTTDAVRTLPVGVVSLQTVESGLTYHIVMAGNVLMIIPIAVAFVLAQKQIIKAFTYTGDR